MIEQLPLRTDIYQDVANRNSILIQIRVIRHEDLFNIVILTICLVLSGCTPEDQATTISFDNRISFSKFPAVVSLDSGTIIDTKTIGNLQFRVIDSLMVIATAERENTWKVRSIPGDSTLLEFISIGSGPDEFVSSPLISQASFFNGDGNIYILLPDNYRQQLRKIDLSKSIDSGQMESDVENNPRINNFSVYSNFSDTSTRIFVSVNPSEGSIERTILKDGSELSLNSIQHLNQYKVPAPDKLGLLMPNIIFNCDKNRIVEVLELYPQFNIYSLDDNFSVTVMPEGKIDSYKRYIDNETAENKELIYSGVNGYEKFFVINKINGEKSELWFFNWDGMPLLDIKLPELATSFDIDFRNHTLYTLNFKNDIFKKYDLKDILESVSQ